MATSLVSLRSLFYNKRVSGCAFAAVNLLLSRTSASTTSAWVSPIGSSTTTVATAVSPLITLQDQKSFSTMSAETKSLEVVQFKSLSDNYGYILHDSASGATAAVDTPDAADYKNELQRRGWKLTHILNTHHHWDHTGGNEELKAMGGVTVIGPNNERKPIPGMDQAVGEGDTVEFGGSKAIVMKAGGHTHGHIAYYFPDQAMIFVGDCLFSLGCGRMFEGTQEQFWSSLEGLRQLPDDTLVYCAHEYTESNAKFAMSVEPNNPDLVQRVAIIKSKRSRGDPTVPSLLGEEKKANPFLRVDFSDEIRANIGALESDSPAVAFGKLRKAKDNF